MHHIVNDRGFVSSIIFFFEDGQTSKPSEPQGSGNSESVYKRGEDG